MKLQNIVIIIPTLTGLITRLNTQNKLHILFLFIYKQDLDQNYSICQNSSALLHALTLLTAYIGRG